MHKREHWQAFDVREQFDVSGEKFLRTLADWEESVF